MIGTTANNTKILYKPETATEFKELEHLMEVPELGSAPEKIDVTTLSDGVKRYIHGIKDMGDLAFKFLYDNTSIDSNYKLLKELEESGDEAEFKITYPDDTSHSFRALVWLKMDAGTVNGALTFTCNMTMQSDIISE